MTKRLVNLILGFIYVIMSVYVASNPGIAVSSLILLLGFVLVFSGIIRIFNSLYEPDIGGTHRLFRLVMGVIGGFIGLSVIAIPGLGLEILVILLGVGLLLQGLIRVHNALTLDSLPKWLRIGLLVMGAITIFLAVYVFLSLDLAILTLVLYLAFGFMFNGIGRLTMAITGFSTQSRT